MPFVATQYTEQSQRIIDIGDRDIELTRAAWKIIEPETVRILDRFYDHLMDRNFGRIFKTSNIDRLKVAQQIYWQKLFDGAFDSLYNAELTAIVAKHKAANVSLSHYLAAYAWFSEQFLNILVDCDPGPGMKREELIVATNKLIYFDVMTVSDAYDRFLVI